MRAKGAIRCANPTRPSSLLVLTDSEQRLVLPPLLKVYCQPLTVPHCLPPPHTIPWCQAPSSMCRDLSAECCPVSQGSRQQTPSRCQPWGP